MALQPCKECEAQVSSHAPFCPSCGTPFRAADKPLLEFEKRLDEHFRTYHRGVLWLLALITVSSMTTAAVVTLDRTVQLGFQQRLWSALQGEGESPPTPVPSRGSSRVAPPPRPPPIEHDCDTIVAECEAGNPAFCERVRLECR